MMMRRRKMIGYDEEKKEKKLNEKMKYEKIKLTEENELKQKETELKLI